MNSKFNKSRQCSLKRTHVVLTEINPELWSRPSPFSTKTGSYRFTNHRNLQKQSNEDFFIQLLYAWLHLTNNIPPPYIKKKFLSNPYLYTHTPDWTLSIIPPSNISDKFTITWNICRFLQPGLVSSRIFCKKLDFHTANHNRYIKLHWAQFPIIGNTHVELKNPL